MASIKECKGICTAFVNEANHKYDTAHESAHNNTRYLILMNSYSAQGCYKVLCAKREHRVVEAGKRGLCIKDTVEVPANVYHDKAANNREYMVAASFLVNVQKMC